IISRKPKMTLLTYTTLFRSKDKDIKTLIVAGGVAANSALRDRFETLTKENNIELYIPSLKYCTDNAAMIGAVAYELYKQKTFANLNLNGQNYIDIEEVY